MPVKSIQIHTLVPIPVIHASTTRRHVTYDNQISCISDDPSTDNNPCNAYLYSRSDYVTYHNHVYLDTCCLSDDSHDSHTGSNPCKAYPPPCGHHGTCNWLVDNVISCTCSSGYGGLSCDGMLSYYNINARKLMLQSII